MKPKKLRLPPRHGWRAQANHKILVIRLKYPETWVVEITDDCVKLHDKELPDDDCVLGVSYHRWTPVTAPTLTVAALVRTAMVSDERKFVALDPVAYDGYRGSPETHNSTASLACSGHKAGRKVRMVHSRVVMSPKEAADERESKEL